MRLFGVKSNDYLSPRLSCVDKCLLTINSRSKFGALESTVQIERIAACYISFPSVDDKCFSTIYRAVASLRCFSPFSLVDISEVTSSIRPR